MQTKEDLEAEAAKEDAPKEVIRALREAKKSNEPYINKEHIQKNMEELSAVQEDFGYINDLIDKLNKR